MNLIDNTPQPKFQEDTKDELNKFTQLAKKLFSIHKSEIQDKQNPESHEPPKNKI